MSRSQYADMAKDQQRWFLKAWRKHRGYTQERLAEMVGSSAGYISDMEKGKRRYNQDLLEALAEALRCEPADLIMRDPTVGESVWSIWDQIPETERDQALRVLSSFRKAS